MTPSAIPPTGSPIIIRHHGLRHVSEREVLDAVGGLASLHGIPRQMEIETLSLAQDVENAGWGSSHSAMWQAARDIRAMLQQTPDARAIYAGIAEVPQILALGAYLGDEWTVETYDHHRETGAWGWLSDDQTLTLETTGLPRDRMGAAGAAVLRIEISASVDEEHIREFVPEGDEIAHVQIRPRGTLPRVADLIRSPADVREVRRAVREAISTLVEQRPNLKVIHLFIAAPVSACFVTGQELRIRNNPPVQTYRYRRSAEGVGVTRPALRLTASGPAPEDLPLSAEEQARSSLLREEVWEAALRDVERYAARKRLDAARRPLAAGVFCRWYEQLVLFEEWRRVRPFATLPAVQDMIEDGSVVDPISMESAYFGYERDRKHWRVNDRFLVSLDHAFGGDLAAARTLVRLFMFHEALHVAHGITKAKVEEIGKFANGLEHVDYTADLYAVLHELDRAVDADPSLAADFVRLKDHAAGLIDLVIRSFWAFEDQGALERMEIRRLRRYLNWYWQQIRVRMSRTPLQLAAVLARKPIVEIAGLAPQVESRRLYGSLHRFDSLVGLELGIVLDNEEVWRIPSKVTVGLTELMDAFSRQAHTEIQQAFRSIFEDVAGSKHPLPSEEDLP